MLVLLWLEPQFLEPFPGKCWFCSGWSHSFWNLFHFHTDPTLGSSVSTLREFKNGDLKEVSKATNETPSDAVENQSSTCRVANKNLFLFEDVDAVVDEDRGFINTIMQLAETSRRPIILTTNSKNPILPPVLSRLVVDFTRPSTAELLAHMLRVCVAEGAQTSPWLVERLIRTCQGDIRKTLLLLQFWCQGQRGQQGTSWFLEKCTIGVVAGLQPTLWFQFTNPVVLWMPQATSWKVEEA